MSTRPGISIIGCGKVGAAVAQLAHRAGRPPVALADRHAAAARSVAEAIGRPDAACAPAEAAAAGPLVLLAVNDDAIAALCENLAEIKAFRPGTIVAHCCGALPGEILAPARDKCGCSIGSMHPLQTFPSVQAAIEKFPGTYCFCEGDDAAVAALQQLARDLGGIPVRIDSDAKVLYHAAAVVACNYLVALLDAATALYARAGIDTGTALAALKPLLAATLENVTELGPAAALTGPIARGDIQTVRRHLDAMRNCPPELQEFYRVAGRWTLQLALRSGELKPGAADAMRRLLETRNPKEQAHGSTVD